MGGGPKREGGQAPHAVFLLPTHPPPPQPRGVGKLDLDFLRQGRGRSRHLRACLPVFVLAEGFTGLFEKLLPSVRIWRNQDMDQRGAEGASDGDLEVVLLSKWRMNCPPQPENHRGAGSELKPSRTCKFSEPPSPACLGIYTSVLEDTH